MNSLLPRLRRMAAFLGVDERRCVACLTPFSPSARHQKQAFSPHIQRYPLCPECLAQIPRLTGGYCPHCGEIVTSVSSFATPASRPPAPPAPIAPCGSCLKSAPPWHEFRFYGVFEHLLRELLHRAKFQGEAAALEIVGLLLQEACADLPVPDAIIPMPLHPARLQHRGFNQCLEMARPLTRHWGVPLRHKWLERRRHTAPQTGLRRTERLINLNNAFFAAPDVAHQHILLIDDTATTGTSLRRATEALLLAGAAGVNVAVIARASRNTKR